MGLNTHRKNKSHQIQLLSVLLLSLWTLPVKALDLGRIQILSGMGEPLRAEVEVNQASPDQLSSLRAQLAAPSTFSQSGMEFNPALEGVTASLQTRSNGASFIALNGTLPVRENFIDLILETQWATGRLVKNYALLLNSISDRATMPAPAATTSTELPSRDTPQVSATNSTQAPIVQAAASGSPVQTFSVPDGLNASSVSLNAQNVPVYRFEPIDNPTTPAAARTTALSAPAVLAQPNIAFNATNSAEPQIQVRPGDTASRLAMRFLTPSVSMDQMLLAMLQANPNAFIQGNVNLVKAGAILRIPSQEQALQIPPAQARRIVLAQTRDFAEYAKRLAQSALSVGGKTTREITGKVGVDKPQDLSATPQQDKLTLSKASIQNDGAEAALASAREADDAQNQLAELNKNLQDLEALVNGQPAGSAVSSPAAASTPTSQVIAQTDANAKPDEKAPAQSEVKTSSWLKNLQDNQQLWAWAGALLALILLLVFWARRKSNEPETVYSPSYDDIPATSTDPVMDHAPADSVIPAQMSAIDLNLQTPTSVATASHAASFPAQSYAAPSNVSQTVFQPASAPAPGSAVDTEQSKLDLAAQLLAKGDKDLARALILSVISSASGELKAKAIQLLGQIR